MKKDDVIESFGTNPPQTVRVDRVVQGPNKDGFVTVPGTYQAILQPRQAGMVDYGAFIRYNPPANGNRADTMGSLSYANMVADNNGSIEGYSGSCSSCSGATVEGYCSGCSEGYKNPGCRGNANAPASSYAQQYNKLNYNETSDMLPVQNMGAMGVNALGEASVQPIVYDRYMYANQRSRLQSVGVDRLRGDIAITPINQGWFSPSANPNIDLAGGALAAMGGINNDSTKALLALKSAASGGYLSTGSGINYGVQKSSFAMPTGGIRVTSFP